MSRLDTFFRDASGRLVVVQVPNPALCVWLLATVLRRSAYDSHDAELRWIGAGALIVWSLDEALDAALGDDPLAAIRAERADHYLGGPDRSDPARRFTDLVTELSGS